MNRVGVEAINARYVKYGVKITPVPLQPPPAPAAPPDPRPGHTDPSRALKAIQGGKADA